MSRPILPTDPAAMLAWQRTQPASGQPTTAELFNRALTGTDFLGDLTPHANMLALSADATDAAIEQWEAANDVPANTLAVAPAVINTVRRMLVAHASDRLMDAADAANDARADAIEAGDIDGDGSPIPYDRSRSAV